MRSTAFGSRVASVAALVAWSLASAVVASGPAGAQSAGMPGKVPITTSSSEARELYLRGRALAEALRATDARKYYEQAVAKDPQFALAFVGLANTSGTTKAFIDAVGKAVALAPKVSEGERHIILGLEAGLKGEPDLQADHYSRLVKAYPNDERARMLLGTYYFGRQDFATAVEQYVRATKINAEFSPVYNQLGYAYRAQEKYVESERAFQKYIDLLPTDPNPYDSYAELLMKTGRFEESIKYYEKALSIDPNFIASYIGIGNNQLFMDQPEKARATFARLTGVARTTGERRAAHNWTAASYVQEGLSDKAIAELEKAAALAKAEGDMATVSNDLNQIGDILREAGRPADALAKYRESLEVMNKALVPEEVKTATRRNTLFEEGRLAALTGDLPTAKSRLKDYAAQAKAKQVPFEIRQQHELSGLIALAEKRPAEAVSDFEKANQQDPRVLYLLAQALQAAGDGARARSMATRAATLNTLNFNNAYVRAKARRLGTN
jgi:tetratricopeptide (TPR) repeat protein